MSRSAVFFLGVVLLVGCRLPPEREPLRPLPEDGARFAYSELIARARVQTTAALEAFYDDSWADLEQAAHGLEQTARFLPRTGDIPAGLKDRLGREAEQLRGDALKLAESARAKDARAANEVLQRINSQIRQLRPGDPAPPPLPPKKEKE